MYSTARRGLDVVPDLVRSRRRGPRLVLGRRPAYRGFDIRKTASIDVHFVVRLCESPWTGYRPTYSRRRQRWASALALPRADRERWRSSIPMGGHKIGARGCARRPTRPPRRLASSTPWSAARGAQRLAHAAPALGRGWAAPWIGRRRQPVFVGEGSYIYGEALGSNFRPYLLSGRTSEAKIELIEKSTLAKTTSTQPVLTSRAAARPDVRLRTRFLALQLAHRSNIGRRLLPRHA